MNSKDPNDSFFKKKGFFVALYACVGVVLVLAAVVSIRNISGLKDDTQNQTAEADLGDMQTTNGSSLDTYNDPYSQDSTAVNGNTVTVPSSKPSASADTSTDSKASPTVAPTEASSPVATKSSDSSAADDSGNTSATDSTNDNQENNSESDTSSSNFEPYTTADKMSWPVEGDVVMPYSDTVAVYDETLDQYRTNDDICISASAGTQVLAAYDGVVKDVSFDPVDGNTVVIDNGNGYETTYSQLQDGVLVNAGDTVTKGEPIGGVANPTIYSVLLGPHVGFEVTENGEPIDPMTVLK